MEIIYCPDCRSYPKHEDESFCVVEIINYVTGEIHEKQINCRSENVDGDCPSYDPKDKVKKPKVFCKDCAFYPTHSKKFLCNEETLDFVTKKKKPKVTRCKIRNVAGNCESFLPL